MHNFSVKQSLHLFMVPLYALARLIMDQWMLKFVPLSLVPRCILRVLRNYLSSFIDTCHYFTIIRF